MHLISALCAGISGAANGTVDIYRRGTTTRAPYYPTFEGGSSVTPVAAIPLDANGGVVAYVNELVNCVVKDSGGVTVRTFVAGDSAPAVEVVSDSFTGTDYTTALSAVSKPTTLQAILDKWNDSAGTPDFNVLVGGSPATLQAAIAAVGAFYYNIKSTTYGAVGNGVADDTAAVQAACVACAAAGGGVVFAPAGTYRLTSTVTVGTNVCIVGTGGSASVFKIDHATAGAFTCSATNGLASVGVDCAQANSGALVTVNECVVRDCKLNASRLNTGTMVKAVNTSLVTIDGCIFSMSGTGRAYSDSTAVGTTLQISRSLFEVVQATPYTGTIVDIAGSTYVAAEISNCSLRHYATSGTVVWVGVSAPSLVTVNGNSAALTSSGATFTFIAQSGALSTVVEYGNAVYTGTVQAGMTYVIQASAATSRFEGLASFRLGNRRYMAAASAALNPQQYGYVEVEATTTAAFSPTFAEPPFVGMDFTLAWYNNQGAGSGTITMDAFVKGLASFTVNANSVSYYYFRSVERGTATRKWALVGSLVNQTP